MSTITVTGNVTRDPELRFTSTNKAVVAFAVAENRKDDQTSFFEVRAWESLAENVAECVTKGMRVVVTGRMEQQTWEKDGQKQSRYVITADEIAPSLRWATAQVTKTERSGA